MKEGYGRTYGDIVSGRSQWGGSFSVRNRIGTVRDRGTGEPKSSISKGCEP